MIKNLRKQALGFTLVELSVVIVIIGLLMAAGLKLFTAQAEAAAYSATQKKIDSIKIALSNHLRVNKRLPCPDVGPAGAAPSAANRYDGIEDRKTAGDVNTQCLDPFGVVPFVTLGIPQETASDGWDNFISYRVYYVDGSAINDSTRSATFRSGNVGMIQVLNRFPPSNASTTPIVTNAVVVLISHGKNGLGGWTTKSTLLSVDGIGGDELTNTQANNYIKRDFSDDATSTFGQFDDVVSFLTANDLLAPLIQDGSIQSAEAIAAFDIQEIRKALIGYIAANNKNATFSGSTALCAPPSTLAGLNVAHTIDPWGTAYLYGLSPAAVTPSTIYPINAPFTQISNAGNFLNGATVLNASLVRLSIASAGPDLAFDTPDDPLPSSITGNEILNQLGTTWISAQCP